MSYIFTLAYHDSRIFQVGLNLHSLPEADEEAYNTKVWKTILLKKILLQVKQYQKALLCRGSFPACVNLVRRQCYLKSLV